MNTALTVEAAARELNRQRVLRRTMRLAMVVGLLSLIVGVHDTLVGAYDSQVRGVILAVAGAAAMAGVTGFNSFIAKRELSPYVQVGAALGTVVIALSILVSEVQGFVWQLPPRTPVQIPVPGLITNWAMVTLAWSCLAALSLSLLMRFSPWYGKRYPWTQDRFCRLVAWTLGVAGIVSALTLVGQGDVFTWSDLIWWSTPIAGAGLIALLGSARDLSATRFGGLQRIVLSLDSAVIAGLLIAVQTRFWDFSLALDNPLLMFVLPWAGLLLIALASLSSELAQVTRGHPAWRLSPAAANEQTTTAITLGVLAVVAVATGILGPTSSYVWAVLGSTQLGTAVGVALAFLGVLALVSALRMKKWRPGSPFPALWATTIAVLGVVVWLGSVDPDLVPLLGPSVIGVALLGGALTLTSVVFKNSNFHPHDADPISMLEALWRVTPLIPIGIFVSAAQFWYSGQFVPAAIAPTLAVHGEMTLIGHSQQGSAVAVLLTVKNISDSREQVLGSRYVVTAIQVRPTTQAFSQTITYAQKDLGTSRVAFEEKCAKVVEVNRLLPDAWYLEKGESYEKTFVVFIPDGNYDAVRVRVDIALANQGRLNMGGTPEYTSYPDLVVTKHPVVDPTWARLVSRPPADVIEYWFHSGDVTPDNQLSIDVVDKWGRQLAIAQDLTYTTSVHELSLWPAAGAGTGAATPSPQPCSP